jgi:uncharacterized protein (TIGR03067 family)
MQRIEAGGKKSEYKWQITHVGIEKDQWTFLMEQAGRKNRNASYFLTLNPAKQPCTLEFHAQRGGDVRMRGIIRRKGDTVEILYLGGSRVHPASFEAPPTGFYLLTLKRETSS